MTDHTTHRTAAGRPPSEPTHRAIAEGIIRSTPFTADRGALAAGEALLLALVHATLDQVPPSVAVGGASASTARLLGKQSDTIAGLEYQLRQLHATVEQMSATINEQHARLDDLHARYHEALRQRDSATTQVNGLQAKLDAATITTAAAR